MIILKIIDFILTLIMVLLAFGTLALVLFWWVPPFLSKKK